MPDDHGEENETAPPVTSQPIPGPQEPETGSREPAMESAPRQRGFVSGALNVLVAVVVVWLLSAYVVLPALWRHYGHQPCCKHAPKTTRTAEGIPGDPLNVGLIGTKEEVVQAMTGLGWFPTDPITAESSFLIAYSVLLDRPYAACIKRLRACPRRSLPSQTVDSNDVPFFPSVRAIGRPLKGENSVGRRCARGRKASTWSDDAAAISLHCRGAFRLQQQKNRRAGT